MKNSFETQKSLNNTVSNKVSAESQQNFSWQNWQVSLDKVSRNGLGGLVLAGPVFLKVKIKFYFYKSKQLTKALVSFLDLLGLLY